MAGQEDFKARLGKLQQSDNGSGADADSRDELTAGLSSAMRNKPMTSEPGLRAKAAETMKEGATNTLNSMASALKVAAIIVVVSFFIGLIAQSVIMGTDLIEPIYDLGFIAVGVVGMFYGGVLFMGGRVKDGVWLFSFASGFILGAGLVFAGIAPSI